MWSWKVKGTLLVNICFNPFSAQNYSTPGARRRRSSSAPTAAEAHEDLSFWLTPPAIHVAGTWRGLWCWMKAERQSAPAGAVPTKYCNCDQEPLVITQTAYNNVTADRQSQHGRYNGKCLSTNRINQPCNTLWEMSWESQSSFTCLKKKKNVLAVPVTSTRKSFWKLGALVKILQDVPFSLTINWR